jgi:putative hydrolase of the HAD superfamily
MTEVKGLVFDLFFTLVNPMREDFVRDSEYAVLKIERSEMQRRNSIDHIARNTGQIRDPYEIMHRILCGLNISEDILIRAADVRLERLRRTLYGIEQKNRNILKNLRELGFKIALLSNADVVDIYYWQGSPLSALFDKVIFSCDVGLLKPDLKIFCLALDALGLSSNQVFYVGDGSHDEFRGAREAGITTILTTEYITHTWPDKIPALKEDADYHIERLEDLLGIMGIYGANSAVSKAGV